MYILILILLVGTSIPLITMSEHYAVLLIYALFTLISFVLISKKKLQFEHFIMALLASSAIPHSVTLGGLNVSISDAYIAVMVVLLVIFSKFELSIPKTYFVITITYLAFCALSLAWANDFTNGLARLIQLIEFMLITVYVFYNIRSTKFLKTMMNWYIGLATVLGAIAVGYSLAQHVTGPLYILGFHKNALGSVLGTSIPLIYGLLLLNKDCSKKVKLTYLFCLFITVFGLLMTMSRGAFLGSIAAIIVLLYFTNKTKQILGILGLIAVCFGLYAFILSPSYLESVTRFDEYSSAYSRVIIYDDVTSKIKEHPYIGHGVGNYFISIPQINFSQDDPNNIFLLNLVELGVVGLVFFVLMILYIVGVAFKNKREFKQNHELLTLNAIFIAGFVARFVHIQVDVSWVRGPGLFMFAMVGMLLSLRKIVKNIKQGS
ncbi:O-antigen ligase family protein [Ectobacillus funiculus]|uniref:O-antigen ligase family protein n=2 Tax=Ectobacillus funiculus TaxID=137993 RepID=A0ABV5WBH8_9BACI